LIFITLTHYCTIDIEHYIASFFACQYFFVRIFLKKGKYLAGMSSAQAIKYSDFFDFDSMFFLEKPIKKMTTNVKIYRLCIENRRFGENTEQNITSCNVAKTILRLLPTNT